MLSTNSTVGEMLNRTKSEKTVIDTDPNILANEACRTASKDSTISIENNRNVVNSILTEIVQLANSLHADSSLLSVNSVFGGSENEKAVESVNFLKEACNNMRTAVSSCQQLKDVLELNRTEMLVNYEREIENINAMTEKTINDAREKIQDTIKNVKKAIFLSCSTACDLFLKPKKIKYDHGVKIDFIYNKKKPSVEEESIASSGYYEDEVDLDQSILYEQEYANNTDDEEVYSVPVGREKNLLKIMPPKRNIIKPKVQKKPQTAIPLRYTNVENSAPKFSLSEPSITTKRKVTEIHQEAVFNDAIFGNCLVDPLKVSQVSDKPKLLPSLAVNFIFKNLESIDKNSPLANIMYEICHYGFLTNTQMFEALADKLSIPRSSFIDLKEAIQFPTGSNKMNVMLNRFSDELSKTAHCESSGFKNTAILIANIFVHLTKFGKNGYYKNFLSEVKVESD